MVWLCGSLNLIKKFGLWKVIVNVCKVILKYIFLFKNIFKYYIKDTFKNKSVLKNYWLVWFYKRLNLHAYFAITGDQYNQTME